MTTKVSLPLQFSRNYAAPLDSLSVFDNLTVLNSAISSNFSYPGMIATVKDAENNGKVFVLNSTKEEWLQVSGSTSGSSNITVLGTISTGTWNAGTIAVAHGGTGATDATAARTNLGVRIGTNVQAYNSTLAAVAGGTYTGDDSITTVGTVATGTWNAATIAVAKGGTGGTDAATARTGLGVRIGTDVQAYNATLGSVAAGTYTGSTSITTVGTVSTGTWNAATIAVAKGGTGGTDAATARTNLEVRIGTDVQAYSAVLGSVAAGTYTGDDSITTVGTIGTGTWNAATIALAKGGTGATNNVTARTNLGVRIGTDVQGYNSTLAAVAGGTYTGDDSITTVGTIATGTWNGALNFGSGSANNLTGEFVISNGLPAGWSRSKYSIFVSYAESVNAVSFELKGASNSVINPATGTVLQFVIQISARSTADDCAGWTIKGVLKDTSSGVSIVGSTTKEFWGDSIFTGGEVDVSIGVGTGHLAIGGTGISGKTIRWSAVSHLCWTS